MSSSEQKVVGIQDIADKLGISIGTVDRALHNRPGISPVTRKKVLNTAEMLGYKPNTAARSLKLNRRLYIGVFLPREISFFFDTLRDGIRIAAEGAAQQVRLEFHTYPRLGEGDVEAIRAADWKKFDGLILAPGEADHMAEITREAAHLGKPVVFVATDASRLNRKASIATDSLVSGGIAAELLGHLIPETASVALFTGSLKVEDHAEKLRGFAGTLAMLAPHLTMLPVIETHESSEKAFSSAMNLLTGHKDLRGIYINTANSLPVLEAIRQSKAKQAIRVIATDLFPELASLIASGQVAASLYQRPSTQGRMALESLLQCLDEKPLPHPVVRLAPHIVLRSNLSLFTNTLERDEALPHDRQ